MDVIGRAPSSKAGGHFRASVWSWRPIHYLVCRLCSDILDEETLDNMNYNSGAGPEDQATCTEMAIRFENWMERHVDGVSLDLGMYVKTDGRLVAEDDIEDPDTEVMPAHEVSDDHLKEWIEFLRHCGGLEVW